MNIFLLFWDLVIHLDKHLDYIIQSFGMWTYAILFLIIFIETGIVIAPFLPGDSLLFAAGAFAGIGSLDLGYLILLLIAAAVLGDSLNYGIGAFLGPKVFTGKYKLLRKEYLDKTHSFYEKYGGKTIIIARFVPVVRSVAPFVAGIGKMKYSKFLLYNVVGAVLWVGLFTLGGYFFGNLSFVKENFGLVILAIILLSVIPMGIEWVKHRKTHRKEKKK